MLSSAACRWLPGGRARLEPVKDSSISLPLTASERSLSAVEAGEFLEDAFLTLESDDLLGGFFRLVVWGVLRRPPELPLIEPALGPALPALAPPPAPLPDAPLGVPGPREACLARPLDVTGAFPVIVVRLTRFAVGPAELSRCCRCSSMLAVGVVGAEAACC
jgi:hypothetical protein